MAQYNAGFQLKTHIIISGYMVFGVFSIIIWVLKNPKNRSKTNIIISGYMVLGPFQNYTIYIPYRKVPKKKVCSRPLKSSRYRPNTSKNFRPAGQISDGRKQGGKVRISADVIA